MNGTTATLMTYGADIGGMLGGLAAMAALCLPLRRPRGKHRKGERVPGKLAIVPARGHRELASHPRPVLDHDQVLIGVRAREKTQARGGPEPRGAAPLISQTLKMGVTVHLARARPCGPT